MPSILELVLLPLKSQDRIKDNEEYAWEKRGPVVVVDFVYQRDLYDIQD
jgi:hypothetical protein